MGRPGADSGRTHASAAPEEIDQTFAQHCAGRQTLEVRSSERISVVPRYLSIPSDRLTGFLRPVSAASLGSSVERHSRGNPERRRERSAPFFHTEPSNPRLIQTVANDLSSGLAENSEPGVAENAPSGVAELVLRLAEKPAPSRVCVPRCRRRRGRGGRRPRFRLPSAATRTAARWPAKGAEGCSDPQSAGCDVTPQRSRARREASCASWRRRRARQRAFDACGGAARTSLG